MDDTTRKIVRFVHEFSASKMTPAATHACNRTMIDSMESLVAGFEEEPCRIAAKVAKLFPPGALKSTVLGYGIETTPEHATFANGCLIRMVDFNDNAEGGHTSTLIPVALAFGEALHSTGQQVMEAIVMGYEVASAPAGGESVIAAMVAGKLMGLDEDRLANALSIALTPHVALNKGVGALPMRADSMAIERNWFKRRPSEASSQGILYMMKEIRAWVKPEEVAAIHWDTSYGVWEEICDAPKWDPTNRETADHSEPYMIARA